jgi:MFS family permease
MPSNQAAHKATETTPLISNAAASPVSNGQPNGHVARGDGASATTIEPDKIPVAQVLFLCAARLFEPIAFFAIFPFVSQMIYDTGEVDETDVGFYTGMIESIFSITQMPFMLLWGRLADNPRIGRKPVLCFSMVGVSISITLFGFSKSIWQMFIFRSLAGVFAGTIVTIRTMLAENSTPKTQARIFSWFAFTGNVGIFLGPLIGGALATPATQYPGVFGHIALFKESPYALPTMVCGAFGLLSTLLAVAFVKETLTNKSKADQSASSLPSEDRLSMIEIVRSPGVAMVLFLQVHIMLLAFSFTAVMPVFYFTSVQRGGLALSPAQQAIFMGVQGLGQAVWSLGAFPWLTKRYGTGGVIRGCARAYPFFFLCYPIGNMILRQDWTLAFWIMSPIFLFIGSGVAMCFTAIQLCINDVNPKPSTLGTLNALALALVSGTRAFTPGLFTSLFAIGLRKRILGGFFIWAILIVIALAFTLDCQWLPPNAEGKVAKPNESEEDDA